MGLYLISSVLFLDSFFSACLCGFSFQFLFCYLILCGFFRTSLGIAIFFSALFLGHTFFSRCAHHYYFRIERNAQLNRTELKKEKKRDQFLWWFFNAVVFLVVFLFSLSLVAVCALVHPAFVCALLKIWIFMVFYGFHLFLVSY